jgi:MFS family permease
MGTFTGFMFSGLTIGPVIAGVMAQRYGWRSFWWFDMAAYILLIAYLVVLVPETKWLRQGRPGHITRVIEATDGQTALDEKVVIDQEEDVGEQPATVEEHADNYVGKGRPSKSQFALWHSFGDVGLKGMIQPFFTPLRLIPMPIIIWMSFAFSGTSCNFLISSLTQSAAFSGPPYNMSSSSVGYLNFASFVGICIGMLTAGPLSDWWCQLQTKRNNGIREPEMRLPVMIPFFILQLIGFVCISVGMQKKWAWEAIVIVGFGFTGIQVAALGNIACTYAVDCYRPVAGDILLLGSLVKDVWAYGVSLWLPPWFISDGFITPLWVCYMVTLIPMALAVPLYFYGKTFRRWSRNSSLHDY